MPLENSKKYNPPYISPRSFYNLLDKLQLDTIPGRVDRSYLDKHFSGAASTQIMAALRFMNLIDSKNVPTHHLRLLVVAIDEERKKRLRDLCTSCYSTIFTNSAIDLQTATYLQLEEAFQSQYGIDGDVRRKCIKFFTSLATDAGIPLSNHITDKVRTTPVNTPPRSTTKKIVPKSSAPAEIPSSVKTAEQNQLLDKLLDKFPGFDPAWNDDQKARWLEGFNLFMKNIYPELKK